MLTIAYMTNRLEPMIEWFFDSLHNEVGENCSGLRVVVTDFYEREYGRREEIARKALKLTQSGAELIHTAPKPTVWQGPYRLTKQDYFAAANARNTAACFAPDGWLVYVDDLSVLLPGWFSRIKAAMEKNYIVCGAYHKVYELRVEHGKAISFRVTPPGSDTRLQWLKDHVPGYDLSPYPAFQGWSFGCSIAMPVEALLAINGWDEDCDSAGAEDYPLGHMLSANGFKLFYDPKMMTYESEEHHSKGVSFPHLQKMNVLGHSDGAWAYLAMLKGGRNRAPNYFGEGGLSGLRAKILAGEPFPPVSIPEHDWRDGQPLREL